MSARGGTLRDRFKSLWGKKDEGDEGEEGDEETEKARVSSGKQSTSILASGSAQASGSKPTQEKLTSKSSPTAAVKQPEAPPSQSASASSRVPMENQSQNLQTPSIPQKSKSALQPTAKSVTNQQRQLPTSGAPVVGKPVSTKPTSKPTAKSSPVGAVKPTTAGVPKTSPATPRSALSSKPASVKAVPAAAAKTVPATATKTVPATAAKPVPAAATTPVPTTAAKPVPAAATTPVPTTAAKPVPAAARTAKPVSTPATTTAARVGKPVSAPVISSSASTATKSSVVQATKTSAAGLGKSIEAPTPVPTVSPARKLSVPHERPVGRASERQITAREMKNSTKAVSKATNEESKTAPTQGKLSSNTEAGRAEEAPRIHRNRPFEDKGDADLSSKIGGANLPTVTVYKGNGFSPQPLRTGPLTSITNIDDTALALRGGRGGAYSAFEEDDENDEELLVEEWERTELGLGEDIVDNPEADFPERNGFVRVWVKDDEVGWVKGYASADGTVFDLFGNERSRNTHVDSHRVSNDDFLDHMDAVELQNLHESTVLHLVHERFKKFKIYTSVGNDVLLIAVNPCMSIPGAYTRKRMRRTHTAGNSMTAHVPHVFSTADAAFRGMMQEKRPQSIIISGDSGAGKTESAKLILRYLAYENHLSKRIATGKKVLSSTIEDRVLETNPILEAFGNAKTHLNHNSSRFGKLLQVMYSDRGMITGAKIRQFLLEKSRVTGAIEGQRNFHIFYQLLRGASPGEREKYHLLPMETYRYLSRTECYDADGIDDREEFSITKQAFTRLGFSTEEVDSILRLVSGILRVGNLEFDTGDNDDVKVKNMADLESLAKLFKVDTKDLEIGMTKRKIVAAGEEIETSYTLKEAETMREGLAKATYKHLFSYLVSRLNELLMTGGDYKKGDSRHGLFVCLLDQAGFEIFENNSLEQLLINFSNEKMQGQFHERISSVERMAYIEEDIDWKEGLDYDPKQNIVRVEALESSPNGVLSMINEEGRLLGGSEEGLLEKLKKFPFRESSNVPMVETSMISDNSFVFHHFAGKVKYNMEGMIEKNKDFLHRDLEEVLAESLCPILSSAFLGKNPSVKKSGKRAQSELMSARTVWVEFKPQINQLVEVLTRTTPRYVRCLKPNDALEPRLFEPARILQQLQYSGVLEFIDVRRNGLPVRMRYSTFKEHFAVITARELKVQLPRDLCAGVLTTEAEFASEYYASAGGDISVKWALGKTKVFIADGLHKWLEDKRLRVIHDTMVFCLSKIRARKIRMEYLETRRKIINYEVAAKRFLAMNHWRRSKAACQVLQRSVLGHLGRRWFADVSKSSRVLVSAWRKHQAREAYVFNELSQMLISMKLRERTSKLTARMYRAARTLQSLQRKRVIRRRMIAYQKLRAFLIYGGVVRKLTNSMRSWKEKYLERRERAAVTIQQAVRKSRASQELYQARKFIPVLSLFRTVLARKSYAHKWRSCVIISAVQRRNVAQRSVRLSAKAATMLSRYSRSLAVKKKSSATCDGVQKLQRAVRSFQARRALNTKACWTIQRAYRGIISKRSFSSKAGSVGVISQASRVLYAKALRETLVRVSPSRFCSDEHAESIHAVVFGPPASGKSSLVNTLLCRRARTVESLDFDDPLDELEGEDDFNIDDDEEGVIATVGIPSGKFQLSDTEAISDFTSAAMVKEELGDRGYDSIFIFVDKINSPRTPREALRALAKAFGKGVWERTLFVFTNCDVNVPGLSFAKLFQRKTTLLYKTLNALGSNSVVPECFAIDNRTARYKAEWIESLQSLYCSIEESSQRLRNERAESVLVLQTMYRQFASYSVFRTAKKSIEDKREQSVSQVLCTAWRVLNAAQMKQNLISKGERLQRFSRMIIGKKHAVDTSEKIANLQNFLRGMSARNGFLKLADSVVALTKMMRSLNPRRDLLMTYQQAAIVQAAYRRSSSSMHTKVLRLVAPNRFETGPDRQFIVCGPSGVGKSSLTHLILGDTVGPETNEFLDDDGDIGMDVSIFTKGKLTMYDTQALGDVSTPDSLRKALAYPEKHASSVFLFVDRFGSHRLPRGSLRTLSQVLGPRMWRQAIIVLSIDDEKDGVGDADSEALMKRKERAFNAAITSIMAELADGDSLCHVPVVAVDCKDGRKSTAGMELVTKLMDTLESVSNSRIRTIQSSQALISRLLRSKTDRYMLYQKVKAQALLSGIGRSVTAKAWKQLELARTEAAATTLRGAARRVHFLCGRDSVKMVGSLTRRSAATSCYAQQRRSVCTIAIAQRIFIARRERDVFLRASPMRFKATRKARPVGAVVYGLEGVGKSSFINLVLEKNKMQVRDTLLASLKMESEGQNSPVLFADVDPNIAFRMYETFPVVDNISAAAVANSLRDPLEHPLTSFVLVDRFDNHRVPRDVIAAATTAFGWSVWKRSIIVLSHGDLLETYKNKINEDVDILDLKSKAYNTCINEVLEAEDGASSKFTAEVPVVIVDNTGTRENYDVLENVARFLDLLKLHAGSRNYLFSFQGLHSQPTTAFQASPSKSRQGTFRAARSMEPEAPPGAGKEKTPDSEPHRTSPLKEVPKARSANSDSSLRIPRSRKRRSYYETLNLPEDAGEAQIRSAYKEMARMFHPDRNRDDMEAAATMFREVTEAYERLVGAKSAGPLGDGDILAHHTEGEVYTSTRGFPVYIKTIHRRYWTAREGEELRAFCRERDLSPLERFEIRWVNQGGFVIRAHDERVVVLAREGDRLILVPQDEAFSDPGDDKIPRYMFKLLFLEDGKFVISAANHRFLCGERGGRLRANRDSAKAWEMFSWRLAPSESGEEFSWDPLVVNLSAHTKNFIDVNPHEAAVTCKSSHPATAERFVLEAVYGQMFRLRGSDGRLLCVAFDGTLVMADEESEDFLRAVRKSEFFADFLDFGLVVLSIVDVQNRLYVSVVNEALELRNRWRKNAELRLRVCFEDTQMMRQIEFFSDDHLPWVDQMEKEEDVQAKPSIPPQAEVMPTKFSRYRQF